MRIEAKAGLRGLLLDADTGRRIPFPKWFDDETGEYEALATVPGNDRVIAEPPRTYRGRARLKFIPAAGKVSGPSLRGPVSNPPAPSCPHPLGRRGATLSPLEVHECEVRACHKRAAWVVQDWRQVEPQRGEGGRLFDRAVLLVRHYFCDRHYRNPVETSLRGVENEVKVQVARPQ